MTSTKKMVNDVLHGYATAALWSSSDNSDESGGEPLDNNYSIGDIASSSLRSMRKDIVKFLRANKKAVYEYADHRVYNRHDGNVWEHLGHDLWLDRNGHGSGFWDRDYDGHDEIGKKLSKAAGKLGESDLYVGDDGELYVSPER